MLVRSRRSVRTWRSRCRSEFRSLSSLEWLGKGADCPPPLCRRCQEIFKSLGCTVDQLSPADRTRLGMSVEEAKGAKRAILQAPPVFPLPKRGPAPKR